jgi:hypothetical protein
MSGENLADMALVLLGAKEAKKEAEKALETANKDIERIEGKLLEQMTAEDIDKFSAHGYLFSPLVQSFPSVNKELEPEFLEWLREHNEDGIYKLSVHAQTLKAFYNQHEEWHEELSEKGFVKVFEKIRIGTRAQK